MATRTAAVERPHLIAAWAIAAALLIGVLVYGLLPALFSGLLVYQLVHLLTPKLRRIHAKAGQLAAVALLAITTVTALLVLVFAGVAFFRSGSSGFQGLAQKISESIEQSRLIAPEWLVDSLPADAEALKAQTVAWLRTHAAMVGGWGRHALEIIVHIIIGMVLGAMVSLYDVLPVQRHGPLGTALIGRAARVADAFRRIVFAQVRIAAINTVFTGIYLLVVLPLLGIHLPFPKTVLAITFIGGMLPVVGNLISNTVIVLLSMSVSFRLAIASLVFLIVIHKLEYFLNARIIGGRIEAHAWELLIAMVAMQAVFGLAGVVAAPIYYAYVKDELTSAKLL